MPKTRITLIEEEKKEIYYILLSVKSLHSFRELTIVVRICVLL